MPTVRFTELSLHGPRCSLLIRMVSLGGFGSLREVKRTKPVRESRDEQDRSTNRHAIVTGGAQGIGFAVAERFLASGASVTLWDRDEELLASAVKTLDLGTLSMP